MNYAEMSVSYNEKKKLFSVYLGERKVKSFKTEREAWAFIALQAGAK
jgi:hypothetical protein